MRWSRLGAILGLVLLTGLPAAAEDRNAIVRSDPAQLEVNAGQIATLNVVLVDAQNVYGIDVSATFDPQVVEVVDADAATEGVQATPGAFPKPDFVARNIADNQAGTLRYATTQVNPTEPVNGSGVIFTIQFRAKASSGQSAFTIATVELTDRDGIALGVQLESGMIRIVPRGQATPTMAATPVVPTSTPTDAPSPAPAGTATPAIRTSTPTSPPAPVETPALPTAVAPSPAPAVTAQMAPPTDASAGSVQPPAAIPAEAAVQSSATPEQSAAQAIAAAPAPATTTPASALDGAQPAAPAGNSAEPRASAVTSKSAASDQAVPDGLPRGQPSTEGASAGRSTSSDPSRILLVIGIGALAAAAVTAVLILLVLRR